MTEWTQDELAGIDRANELDISSRRLNGSFSPWITIWAVRVEDAVYVRSVRGPDATWYRNLIRRAGGRILSEDLEREVGLAEPTHHDEEIDATYRAKFGSASVGTQRITAPVARATTLRLVPSGS